MVTLITAPSEPDLKVKLGRKPLQRAQNFGFERDPALQPFNVAPVLGLSGNDDLIDPRARSEALIMSMI